MARMEQSAKTPLAQRLAAASEILFGLFCLGAVLHERLPRFIASGGREEGRFMAMLLAVATLGMAAMLALDLIEKRLGGRAAMLAVTGVCSVLWLAFAGGVLWSQDAFGAWPTAAALALAPMFIGWAGVGMHLRTMRGASVQPPEPAARGDRSKDRLPGLQQASMLFICMLVLAALLGPAAVAFVEQGWRADAPVLAALFVCLVLLLGVAGWFALVTGRRKGE